MIPGDAMREGVERGRRTLELEQDEPRMILLPRFRLQVLEPVSLAQTWDAGAESCAIGAQAGNDLLLDHPTVSRYHCEITVDDRGARVNDLDSLNGTILDGVRVHSGFLRDGSLLQLGQVVVRFDMGHEINRIPVSPRTRFGSLVGVSVAMRATISLLERAASSDTTVLLEGETGTGKGAAAESLHRAGARRDGPFIVVDCGALSENLLESELFGHEKGAFTGAEARRVGAFEEASGGTIFLDEVGELPHELQPKLLRVLENREIRRVGTNVHRPIDVRVVSATNRDLRAEVNAGRFRADLYYRLAVFKVSLPPLRQRPDDLPELVRALLSGARLLPDHVERLLATDLVSRLRRHAWPGNVRELRNHLERLVLLEDLLQLEPAPPETAGPPPDLSTLPYADARARALGEFERGYVEALLRRHDGNVSRAASTAGVARVHLYRLLHKHGLR